MFKRILAAVALLSLTAFGHAQADTYLEDYPAKISIIVDTSNSMLGVDGATMRQKSAVVRENLAKNTGDMIDVAGMDLWHFGGRHNPQCTPARVYNADRGDARIVEAVQALKTIQAENMLAVNDARNPLYTAIMGAANAGTEGIVLITDSAEDCDMSPRAVCEAAGNIGIPVYVLSMAVTQQGRTDLECLADVSHGAFAHASSGLEIAPLMKTLMRIAISRAQVSIAEQLLLSMNAQIIELVDENQALADENSNLMRANGELSQQVTDLLIVIDERDATIADQAAVIDALRATVAELDEENTALQARVAQLEQQVADQELMIAELRGTIANLEDEVVEQDGIILALHQAVEDLTQKNTELREQVATLTQALAAAEAEIEVLTGHVRQLIADRDALQQEVDSQSQEIANLRVDLQTCRTEKQAMGETIDAQALEIGEMNQAVITATKNCEARVSDVQMSERKQCEAKIGRLEKSCKKQEDNLKARISKLESTVEKRDKSIKALHASIKERDGEIKTLNAARETLANENAELKLVVVEQADIIEGLHISVQQLGTSLSSCNKDLQMCQINYGDLRTNYGVLQDENDALVETIAEYDERVKACKSQLGDAIIEADRLRRVDRENTELRAELAETKAQLDACEADKAAFKNGLSPLVVDHLESPSETVE